MYRVKRSEGIECEVDVYVAPSPRSATRVVQVALATTVVPCLIGWIALYLVHVSSPGIHYMGLRYGTFSQWSGLLFEVAFCELILAPVFPVFSLVRLFQSRRKRRGGKLQIKEHVLRWTSSARSRMMATGEAYCTGVRIGADVRVVAMVNGAESPVTLHVRDSEARRRVESILNVEMSSVGALEFPVWTGQNARSSRLLQRSGLVLFLAASWACIEAPGVPPAFAKLMSSTLISLPGLCLALGLFILSWVPLLRPSPAQKLAIGSAKICVDEELVCSPRDVLALTVTEDVFLEIASSRIPEGKRLIKPWQRGDREELELIKATIEAFQARAAEDAPGASPPNP